MVCLGAVIVEPTLSKTFYGRTRPISKEWLPEALAISGFGRPEHETFDDPREVMERFEAWVVENSKGRPVFASDNLAFDWQFVNWYFHTYLGRNPFGWSGRRIGDLYCGMVKDGYATWKHLRKTVSRPRSGERRQGQCRGPARHDRDGAEAPREIAARRDRRVTRGG